MTDPFASPAPGREPSVAAPPLYGAPLAGTRNGLGVASLVLGILSIVPLALLLLPAVLAITFGVVGRRRVRRGEASNGGAALAGIICGSVGLVLGIAGITLLALFFSSNAGQSYRDCLDAAANNTQAQQVCQTRLQDDILGR